MKSIISKITPIAAIIVVIASLMAALSFTTLTVGAQGFNESGQGIGGGLGAGSDVVDEEGAAQDAGQRIDQIIQLVINVFSIVVGVVSVVMIIVGGLKYITSGGESGSITGAKNTILYALVGLVIVALAQIIVRFVVGRVTTD